MSSKRTLVQQHEAQELKGTCEEILLFGNDPSKIMAIREIIHDFESYCTTSRRATKIPAEIEARFLLWCWGGKIKDGYCNKFVSYFNKNYLSNNCKLKPCGESAVRNAAKNELKKWEVDSNYKEDSNLEEKWDRILCDKKKDVAAKYPLATAM